MAFAAEDAAEREAQKRELRARGQDLAERRQAHQEAKFQAQQARAGQQAPTPPDAPSSSPSLPKAPAIPKGNGSRVIAGAWVAGMAIITWQEVKDNHIAPEPKRFVGWAVAMSILDLLAPLITDELASVFAGGLVIGMLLFRKPSTPEFTQLPTPTSFGETGGVPQGTNFGGAQAAQSQANSVQTPVPFGGAQAAQSQANGNLGGVSN